jgi:N6-L-threonylcarbamoyladenine synthase
MRVLGIETSCDETAAAIVNESGVVFSDVVRSQIAIHAPYGGIVPEIAARDHTRSIVPVIREAVDRAGLKLSDIEGIAVTARPGLAGALLVGLSTAKGLSFSLGVPLVGVDHLVGHLLAVFLQRPGSSIGASDRLRRPSPQAPDSTFGAADRLRRPSPQTPDQPVDVPAYPYLALLASGGHTALYRVDGPDLALIREIGATRDDAAGEAFDKVGKLLGLGYPGGPVIDKLAALGDASRATEALPKSTAYRKNLEFSFSGIKSSVARYVGTTKEPIVGQALHDLCAAFQAAVVETLVAKTIHAARTEGLERVVLAGGVAANRGLRARMAEKCKSAKLGLFVPPFASCTDNAAMIAYAGAQRLVRAEQDGMGLAPATKTALERVTRKGGGVR